MLTTGVYCLKSINLNHMCFTLHSSRLMSMVCSQKTANITLISLNRPKKLNALNLKMVQDLQKNITQFENDQDSACAVLYGQGGNFCSGFDLLELRNNPKSSIYNEFREFLQRPAKKPIIAAVNGYAVGQGLDLALWCDLRFIDENALLGFYNKRFGIPTCDITLNRLKHMIGASRTMDLLLEENHITAQKSLDWGLCSRMATCGTVIGVAVNKAIRLSTCHQQATLAGRAALLSQYETSPEDWRSEERLNTDISLETSKDLIEDFVKEGDRVFKFKHKENLDFLNQ